MRPFASALVVPWLAYVAVTVLGPALNGAWRRPDFAEHALVTILGSGAVLALWLFARRIARRRTSGWNRNTRST